MNPETVFIRTQEEADLEIPALLARPASRRVVVVAPDEPIDLNRAAWGEGLPRPPLEVAARQIAPPGVAAWKCGFLPLRAVDEVRVRSGSGERSDALVRHVCQQVSAAGVALVVE